MKRINNNLNKSKRFPLGNKININNEAQQSPKTNNFNSH